MAGPQAIAIAFAAASTAVAAGGAGASMFGGRLQQKMDLAAIDLNQEQARLQAAEASAQNAMSFRKALASQVALASLRGGAGSVVRQFGGESYSNFLQDQESIKRGSRLTDIRAQQQRAQASGNRATNDLKALTDFAQTALRVWKVPAGGGMGGATK